MAPPLIIHSTMASRVRTRHFRRAAFYFPGDKTIGVINTVKIVATRAEIFSGNTMKVMWGILGVIEARILFIHGKYQLC